MEKLNHTFSGIKKLRTEIYPVLYAKVAGPLEMDAMGAFEFSRSSISDLTIKAALIATDVSRQVVVEVYVECGFAIESPNQIIPKRFFIDKFREVTDIAVTYFDKTVQYFPNLKKVKHPDYISLPPVQKNIEEAYLRLHLLRH